VVTATGTLKWRSIRTKLNPCNLTFMAMARAVLWGISA
jgi:hypothetical protein